MAVRDEKYPGGVFSGYVIAADQNVEGLQADDQDDDNHLPIKMKPVG